MAIVNHRETNEDHLGHVSPASDQVAPPEQEGYRPESGVVARPKSLPALTEEGPTGFGHYVLLDRVAMGGMAEIYLARSRGTHGVPELVVLKRLQPFIASSPDFVHMFMDEAKIAGRLRHPNIVRSFEYGQHDGSYYIVMELVRGMDLRHVLGYMRIRGQRLAPGLAAWITTRICKALAYAHDALDDSGQPLSLIHRDISPHNVLLGFDGSVKLIDFGIAKTTAQSTKTQVGQLKGKLRYMSPEQVRGQPIDRRCDIFSTGNCLFEMLTGQKLFGGADDLTLLGQVRDATARAPSELCDDVSERLDTVVLRALARNPDERYQTANALGAALMQVLRAEGSDASQPALADFMQNAFSQDRAAQNHHVASFQTGRGRATSRGMLRDTVETIDEDLTPIDAERVAQILEAGDRPTQVFFSVDEVEELEVFEELHATDEDPSEDTAPHIDAREEAAPALETPTNMGRPNATVPSNASMPSGVYAPGVTSSGSRHSTWLLPAAALVVGTCVGALLFSSDPGTVLEVRPAGVVSASIEVDGARLGTSTRALEVEPGRHRVRVSAPGRDTYVGHVDVPEQTHTVLAITLPELVPSGARGQVDTGASPPPSVVDPVTATPSTAWEPAVEPTSETPTRTSGVSSEARARRRTKATTTRNRRTASGRARETRTGTRRGARPGPRTERASPQGETPRTALAERSTGASSNPGPDAQRQEAMEPLVGVLGPSPYGQADEETIAAAPEEEPPPREGSGQQAGRPPTPSPGPAPTGRPSARDEPTDGPVGELIPAREQPTPPGRDGLQ